MRLYTTPIPKSRDCRTSFVVRKICHLVDRLNNTWVSDMQAEQATLEAKNYELMKAFSEKSQAQQQLQKLYQSLKAQVMATQVANAAGDQVDHALHSVRADRVVNRLPGTRTGTANF